MIAGESILLLLLLVLLDKDEELDSAVFLVRLFNVIGLCSCANEWSATSPEDDGVDDPESVILVLVVAGFTRVFFRCPVVCFSLTDDIVDARLLTLLTLFPRDVATARRSAKFNCFLCSSRASFTFLFNESWVRDDGAAFMTIDGKRLSS